MVVPPWLAHRQFLPWANLQRGWHHHRRCLPGQRLTEHEAAAKLALELLVPPVLRQRSWVGCSRGGCPSCAVEAE